MIGGNLSVVSQNDTSAYRSGELKIAVIMPFQQL